ncbi:class I SAM-dependent methyltransferase [Phenylobacterium sp.]|uniref:class I SAM-dependent methyltransferase n=1 Tax=Phenylobacterium sp. TaxID=1871053 RepID=UPI002B59FAD4|nr:class I SAM-dependent methyltransferase [Phenylobacterium sp.]HLZ73703.1 class I SAM-dependent methyltransferase [Phenylobacterium sp.]
MAFRDLLRGGRAAAAHAPGAAPAWARPLFAGGLKPLLARDDGRVLVWAIDDPGAAGTITDQFTANAEEYHRRYAASDHFERLFRQGIEASGIAVAPAPLILDLGSGSGVNSIVPCLRLFPGARMVATDLSGELLAMLAGYALDSGASGSVTCVRMDAMGEAVTPGAFDLVTGASILHHLTVPEQGLAAAARALKPGGHAIFFEPFHGWAIMRLAFQWILAEADLRGQPLDPAADAVLRATIVDVAARSDPDPDAAGFAALDDKWLFSRTRIEEAARAAGFGEARFKPHGGKPTIYREMAAVQLRLGSGRDDLTLPAWADDILATFDDALTRDAKLELMMEGTIVLTKAA